MRLAITFTLFCLAGLTFAAESYDSKHALLDELVSAHAKRGVVDYPGLQKEAAKLDKYLGQVAAVDKARFDGFGREEQMAYLINAYNAFTLKLISDFYPIDSIRSIGRKVGGNLFTGKSHQWKISEYEVNGHKVKFVAMGGPITLDEIEHQYLRPKYQDARVHFALVCGAVSCPFLRSEAYTAAKLSAQLEDQGRTFLADPFRNKYDDKSNTLYLSKIFDWFKEDFTREGTLIEKLKPFLAPTVVARLGQGPTVKYLEYDWSLNSKAGNPNR